MLLGLDVGTTALKAVVLDPARGIVGRRVAAAREPVAGPVVVGGRPATRGSPPPSPSCRRSCADAGVAPGDVDGRRRRRLRAVRRCCWTPTTRRCGRRCSTTTGAPSARSTRCATRVGAEARAGPHRRRGHPAVGRAEAALAGSATSRSVVRRAPPRGRLVRLARGRLAGVALQRAQLGAGERPLRPPAADFADDLLAAAGWDRERLAPIRDPADVVGGVSGRDRRGDRAARGHAGRRRAGRPRGLGLRRRARRARRRAGQARRLGRRAGRLGPAAGRRAPVPRRAPAARAVAAERLHGERRLGHPLVPARAGRGHAAGGARRARPPPRPPAPTGWSILPYLLGEKTPLNDPLAAARSSGSGSGTRAGTCSGPCWRASATACGTTSRCCAEHGIAPGPGARWPTAAPRRRCGSRRRRRHGPRAGAASSTTPARPSGPAFAAGMGTGAFGDVGGDRPLRGGRRPPCEPDPAHRGPCTTPATPSTAASTRRSCRPSAPFAAWRRPRA